MFRVVTNFDHWHSIYDSSDCSDTFKNAPLGVAGPSSFPAVTLATSPEGLGQRQFVVVLMVDRLEQLWSLEAVFRLRVGEELENIFARDGMTRRRAVTAVVEVAESVDKKQQAYRREPSAGSKSGPARLVVVAIVGMAVGVGILMLVGGTGEDETRLATELRRQLGDAVKQSSHAADQAAQSLRKIEEIGELFRVSSSEVLADVKKETNDAEGHARAAGDALAEIRRFLAKELAVVREEVRKAAGHAKAADDAWSKTKRVEERVLASAVGGPETRRPKVGDVGKKPDIPVGPTTGDERNVKANESSDTDIRIAEIQQRLLELGYQSVGIVDGLWGKDTKTAILQWSGDTGLCPSLTRTSPDSQYISCAHDKLFDDPTKPASRRLPAISPR